MTSLPPSDSFKKNRYFMEWRERFNDQCGWFEMRVDLEKEIKRIKELDGEGEAEVYRVILGTDQTSEFLGDES